MEKDRAGNSNQFIVKCFANALIYFSGDSGGAFFVQQNSFIFVKGIISSSLYNSERKCDVNRFSLFTDVPKFMDWIKAKVNQTLPMPKTKILDDRMPSFLKVIICLIMLSVTIVVAIVVYILFGNDHLIKNGCMFNDNCLLC